MARPAAAPTTSQTALAARVWRSAGMSGPSLGVSRVLASPESCFAWWRRGGARVGQGCAHRLDRCRAACPGLKCGRALGEEDGPAVDASETQLAGAANQRCPAANVHEVDDGS